MCTAALLRFPNLFVSYRRSPATMEAQIRGLACGAALRIRAMCTRLRLQRFHILLTQSLARPERVTDV
jgi:hypothetical protein